MQKCGHYSKEACKMWSLVTMVTNLTLGKSLRNVHLISIRQFIMRMRGLVPLETCCQYEQ